MAYGFRSEMGRGVMIRAAVAADMAGLAGLWCEGYLEAHVGLAPEELIARRTRARFAARLEGFGDALRVAGPVGAPVGMCVLKGAEVDQMYVAPEGRGAGVAQALLADVKARIAAAGHGHGWLLCAIGNDRAAGFYARQGWENVGEVEVELALEEGPFPLRVWRFEKAVDSGRSLRKPTFACEKIGLRLWDQWQGV